MDVINTCKTIAPRTLIQFLTTFVTNTIRNARTSSCIPSIPHIPRISGSVGFFIVLTKRIDCYDVILLTNIYKWFIEIYDLRPAMEPIDNGVLDAWIVVSGDVYFVCSLDGLVGGRVMHFEFELSGFTSGGSWVLATTY